MCVQLSAAKVLALNKGAGVFLGLYVLPANS